jgi:hypothetical protein
MPAWSAATRSDHRSFCVTEGWTYNGYDHEFYHLTLHDGRILYTKISRPVGRETYGQDLWHQILRTQLQVTEEEFWVCVHDGTVPDRGEPEPPKEALPADLVHQLRTKVRLSDDEISQLTKAEAVERMQEFWMGGG